MRRGAVPSDVGSAVDLDGIRPGLNARVAMAGLFATLGAVAFDHLPTHVAGTVSHTPTIAAAAHALTSTAHDHPSVVSPRRDIVLKVMNWSTRRGIDMSQAAVGACGPAA